MKMEGDEDINDNVFSSKKGSEKKTRTTDILHDVNGHKETAEVESSDYTALFKAIEDGSWETAITFLTTGKLNSFSFFGLGASSGKESNPEEQARTWVVGKDWWGTTTWRRLPIHTAVMRKAPFEVVKRLHDIYPQGVKCSDLGGNLPLHLAFMHRIDDNVKAYLLNVYPGSVYVKNNEDHVPIDYASDGAGDIMNLCIEQTKNNARQEEAKLSQALESEKSRLTEILTQLADIRDELDHLRKTKKKSCDGAEVEDVPSLVVPSEDSAPKESNKKKSSKGSSSRKNLWNKKSRRSVADEEQSSSPQTKNGLNHKKKSTKANKW